MALPNLQSFLIFLTVVTSPKASSSSLSSGLPTGRRPFFLVPSLLPLRTGVSSACPAPSRSRLRTMAAGRKGGPFVNEEFSILMSIKSILSCLSYNCGVFGWRSRTVTFVWWSVVVLCTLCSSLFEVWLEKKWHTWNIIKSDQHTPLQGQSGQ